MDFESGIFSFGGTQAALPDSAEMRQRAAASDKTRVAMIGTYPPRQCGVAQQRDLDALHPAQVAEQRKQGPVRGKACTRQHAACDAIARGLMVIGEYLHNASSWVGR